MIKTIGNSEYFKGSFPSASPTALDSGIFSLCSGGVPTQGGLQRIPGKVIRNTGLENGAVISIYQLNTKIVVQTYVGIVIFDLKDIAPNVLDYVYDNEGNLVTDNFGIPITA